MSSHIILLLTLFINYNLNNSDIIEMKQLDIGQLLYTYGRRRTNLNLTTMVTSRYI